MDKNNDKMNIITVKTSPKFLNVFVRRRYWKKQVISFLLFCLLLGGILVYIIPWYITIKPWYSQYALLRFYNRIGREPGIRSESLKFWLDREPELSKIGINKAFPDTRHPLGSKWNYTQGVSSNLEEYPNNTINIVTVCCGVRIDEALTMIKSAVLLSQDARLRVIVFVDDDTMLEFAQSILKLKIQTNALGIDFIFEIHPIWFPSGHAWKAMWRPCAAQKLFLPTLLPAVDSVLYVDADVLFVSNVTDYWGHFGKMSNLQLATAVANDELPGNGWYNLHSKVPYFGPRGINDGIMLMNLTRMRTIRFQQKCIDIYNKYEDDIILADQDILNILFHFQPELLLEISCAYNFRSSHCGCEHDAYVGDTCKCKAAMEHGVSLVHGNQLVFYGGTMPYPFFRNMYKAFKEFQYGRDSVASLIHRLQTDYQVELDLANPCHNLTPDMLYGNLQNYVKKFNNTYYSLTSTS